MKAVLTSALLSLLLSIGLMGAAGAQSPDPVTARLSAERTPVIEPGLYSAGDKSQFTIAPYRGKFLLRFAGSPESFVLTADSGSVGAKLLKYDTGAAALSVSVWGGVTLYLAEAPNGLPATRQGLAPALVPQPISVRELRGALNDEAAHFSYSGNLALHFAMEAAILTDADTRAMAFDTLAITQMGLERLIATTQGRRALTRRVNTVKLERGAKPGVILSGRSIVVRFTPAQGYLGRVSSHAMASQLAKLLAVSSE